jgi:hypothetical protein
MLLQMHDSFLWFLYAGNIQLATQRGKRLSASSASSASSSFIDPSPSLTYNFYAGHAEAARRIATG